eukprot:scaffold4833_cov233-Amphora_coffeaeformis.AAC.17
MGKDKEKIGYVKGGHALNVRISPERVRDVERSERDVKSSTKSNSQPLRAPFRPKGMKNVGNTCYANSVLQCLLSTALTHALLDPRARKIFRAYSFNLQLLRKGSGSVDSADEDEDDIRVEERRQEKEAKRRKESDAKLRDRCFWLSKELKTITLEYQSEGEPESPSISDYLLGQPPKTPVIDPGCITRRPNWLCPSLRPYQQEDAHEFLRALLSTLAMNGRNRELSSLFDGLLESSVTCLNCGRPSLTRDRYMDLSLDIGGDHIDTLHDALKEFTKTETLSGDNKVHCTKCRSKQNAAKGLRLATAPSILVCHMKRFAFDKNGGLVRLSKKVKFPEELDMKNYMSNLNRARPPPYELVAVLVHQGRSCEWGHYVAYVKNHRQWYCCNDSSVTAVSFEKVLQQQAYILMYEVAEMREKHGFPSPNGAPEVRFAENRGIAETLMSTVFCGMDDTVFRDVCFQKKRHDLVQKSCASTPKRSKKKQPVHEDTIHTSRSDDFSALMGESHMTVSSHDTKESLLTKSSMRRATSSSDLKKEGAKSEQISLMQRQRSYNGDIKRGHSDEKRTENLTPVRRNNLRPGDLPPRNQGVRLASL